MSSLFILWLLGKLAKITESSESKTNCGETDWTGCSECRESWRYDTQTMDEFHEEQDDYDMMDDIF